MTRETPPSEGIPRPVETGPVSARSKRDTWFGEGAPARKFLGRWGFALVVVVIAVLGRAVLLPFVFASLIAYILAPIVARMTRRKNGAKRMPRGPAIVI